MSVAAVNKRDSRSPSLKDVCLQNGYKYLRQASMFEKTDNLAISISFKCNHQKIIIVISDSFTERFFKMNYK